MTNRDSYLAAADAIGMRLCRDAFWHEQQCTWLGWNMEHIAPSWQSAYRAFGADLYAGSSGICLFLAELYSLTGNHRLLRTIRGGCQQILASLEQHRGPSNIGFHSGAVGIAYALTHIGTRIQAPELVSAGLELAESLHDHSPDARFLDVIGGSAGIIPALLYLAEQHQRPRLAEIAQAHGQHLLACHLEKDGCYQWDTMHVPGQAPLTGHSHGLAGIVTALLELHKRYGGYSDAIAAALAYERRLFSPQHSNWPDLRLMGQAQGSTEPTYNMAWCHGAPGIGLSRLRDLAIVKALTPQHETEIQALEAEINAALHSTGQALQMPWRPGIGNFSLCHGAAGNAELFIMAAQGLQRPELMDVAHKVAADGLLHYSQPDLPWPCGVMNAGETPGLLLGIAGIGHFYLRLYAPERVPSILLINPDYNMSQAA